MEKDIGVTRRVERAGAHQVPALQGLGELLGVVTPDRAAKGGGVKVHGLLRSHRLPVTGWDGLGCPVWKGVS